MRNAAQPQAMLCLSRRGFVFFDKIGQAIRVENGRPPERMAAKQAAERRIKICRIANLIKLLERRAFAAVPEAVVFGEEVPRIANTSLIALPGVDAETQIMALDLAGVYVSAGSACSSGKVAESHVLQAMGVDNAVSRCAIRISLGFENTLEEVDKFIEVWSSLAKRRGT